MRVLTRNVFSLILLLIFFLSAFCASADNGDTIVYRTKTGECYHKKTCSYLKSCIPLTLEEAVAMGLRPCSRCKPPEFDTESQNETRTEFVKNDDSNYDRIAEEYNRIRNGNRSSNGSRSSNNSISARAAVPPTQSVITTHGFDLLERLQSEWDVSLVSASAGAILSGVFTSLLWRAKIRQQKREK